MAKAKVKTKTIVSIIDLILPIVKHGRSPICEAGSLIGVTTSRININTNIIITKNIVITKH